MRFSGLLSRGQFLRALGAAALLPLLPRSALAATVFRRRRPSDAAWPSPAAWQGLNKAVGGNLIAVKFPLSGWNTNTGLSNDLKNPYYIGDQPGLTETLGWVDAWTTKPSVYAVAARNAQDIAAAVNFARDNNLRMAVKGGGHSYKGASNAPDSLLIWTRHMHDISLHPAFVAHGCEHSAKPQAAVTLGAGTIGMQAYTAVTTRGGKYVQGGGCLTVGLAGLVQGGGFGSYSKHYGTAAGSLLEAEIVTADGQIRIANACTNPDLFWALKGGGGSTFGVVSRLTLKLHDVAEHVGVANFKVKASSDAAYRRLLHEFVRFYRANLFNDHWGEQARFGLNNVLDIQMNSHGLSTAQSQKVWQPFLDWVKASPQDYSLPDRVVIATVPGRRWWDVQWWKEHWSELAFPNPGFFAGIVEFGLQHLMQQPVFLFDDRLGANPNNALWAGNRDEAGQVLWGYESLWLPQSLLAPGAQKRLADALYESSRAFYGSLHFNKGLAGAPPEAIAAARDTATNPAVLAAFALLIVADGEGPAYPGIAGHAPSVAEGRAARVRIARSTAPLRALVPEPAAYVSESDYFEKNWQQAYWGSNYPRLLEIKKKYDPDGLFTVHHGVGSEQWSRDGFTRL